MKKTPDKETFMKMVEQLFEYADSFGPDEGGKSVAEWLEEELRKRSERKGGEEVVRRHLNAIALERNDTDFRNVKPVGRSRIYCRYQVVLRFDGEGSEKVHFSTSVAECIYMIFLIASAAYDNNQGGFPRSGNMVYAKNSSKISKWVNEVVSALYLAHDVGGLIAKFDNIEMRNQALSKIRKMFKEMNEEQAAFSKKSPDDGDFYKLNDSKVNIVLPEELRGFSDDIKSNISL